MGQSMAGGEVHCFIDAIFVHSLGFRGIHAGMIRGSSFAQFRRGASGLAFHSTRMKLSAPTSDRRVTGGLLVVLACFAVDFGV